MERKAERIAKWAKGRPVGPVRIEIHPTNRCNLRCRFCWQSAVEDPDYSLELSDERLLEVVREAHALGVKEWVVSGGGEPLVRREVTLEAMALMKRYGMWGQLTTNGALFTEADVEHVVRIGWDQVQFSMDGPDPETHDYLRNRAGTFDRAVRAAMLFSEYKRKLKRKIPYLGFNTVLCRLNYDKMESMIELAKDVGYQLVYFEPIYGGYLETERLTLNEAEERALIGHAARAKALAGRLGIDTNADRFARRAELMDKSCFQEVVLRETAVDENPYLNAPCYQPWYLMGIKGCGLTGCCSTFEVGERIQEKSLKEVWYGELFSKLRQEMLSRQLPDYCAKCSVVVVMDNKEIRKHLRRRIR